MAKKIRKQGRPAFVATPEQKQQVEQFAAVGLSQEQIGIIIGVSQDTLDRHFRKELDEGTPKANARVAGALYRQAIGGNTTAMIFWLKTRAGWREKSEVEVSGSINLVAVIEDK